MSIRPEVVPFVLGVVAVFGLLALALRLLKKRAAAAVAVVLGVVGVAYMLYFFRDPQRQAPADPAAIVAGADGTVVAIKEVREDSFLKTDAVRISIYLSLFDVHVNRSPISGKVAHLGKVPGKRYLTMHEESSLYNHHNAILIEGDRFNCLVRQIAGPITREVVYWLEENKPITAGDRIGMMKFGSRLDMYFPKDKVEVRARVGDKVAAGETVVAVAK